MVQGKYVENSNKNLQTVMSMGKCFTLDRYTMLEWPSSNQASLYV